MISWRMAAAWVAALVLTTALTWQIVGLADSQVGDPIALAPSLTTSSVVVDSTTTTVATTTTEPRATPSMPEATSSSSGKSGTSGGSRASSTISSSTSSTSTTAAEADWGVQTVNSVGGTVIVRYRPGEVELQAATPAPGFSAEIDDYGPPRVRVEFFSGEIEVRIEVRWEGGALDIDVDEND